MTTSFISSDQISSYTQEFIKQSDPGSLSATLYSTSKDTLGMFSSAGRVSINIGDNSKDAENGNSNQSSARIAAQLRGRGVATSLYSYGASDVRLHIKSYTNTYGGQAQAFISTGNPSLQSSGVVDRQTRLATKTPTQINVGITTTDSGLIRAITHMQNRIFAKQVPVSESDLLVGANATSALIQSINKTGRGSTIKLASAYADDPYIETALINARERGANVSVILGKGAVDVDHRGFGYGGSKGLRELAGQLAAHDIDVSVPSDDDPLLPHLKAISIEGPGGSETYVGSHNMTAAARNELSVDVLLRITDPKLVKQVSSELGSIKTKYGLISPNKTERLSKVERNLYSQGLGEIYRINSLTSDAITGAPTNDGKTRAPDAMPYYPTSMSDEYFQQFSGGELPTLTLYQDLYQSRLKTNVAPSAIKNIDKALSTPGLGIQINRALGLDVYTTGQGVVGSLLTSVGRAVDTLMGYYDAKEDKQELTGNEQGSIRKFFGLSTNKKEKGGPFEQTLELAYTSALGMSTALAMYAAVNLPIQHALATFQEESLDATVTAARLGGVRGRAIAKFERARRLVLFGPTYGSLLNKAFANTKTDDEAVAAFSKFITNPDENLKVILQKLNKGSKSSLVQLSDERSLFGGITKLRQFDASRFDSILKPILQAINPYKAGSAADNIFQSSLDLMSKRIAQPPVLLFEASAENRNLTQFAFKNVGVERIAEIARGFDRVGSLLPLNLAYWSPAIRESFGLPEFNPKVNLTWRDLFSIEEITRFVPSFYKAVGTTLINPLAMGSVIKQVTYGVPLKEIIKTLPEKLLPIISTAPKAAKLWREQFKVDKLANNLRQSVPQTQLLSLALFEAEAEQAIGVSLQKLHITQTANYNKLADELNSFITGSEFTKYKASSKANIAAANTYLTGRRIESSTSAIHPLQDTDLPSYAKSFIKQPGSAAAGRISKLKKGLLITGLALLTDSVLDQFVLKTGTDLFTQLFAGNELRSKDGVVAKFQYTGNAPAGLALGLGLGVGVVTGLMFPNIVDVTNRSKGLVAPLTDELDNQFKAVANIINRKAEGQALPYLTEELGGLAKAKERYTALLTQLGRTKRIKFNATSAWVAGLTTALFTGLAFKAAAGVANAIHNREGGQSLNNFNALVSARFERLTTEAQKTAQSKGDWVDVALGKIITQANLTVDSGASAVYSIASQVTSPFFQIAGVIKIDTQKKRASFGVGFQFAPVLGLGMSPILPIGIKTAKAAAANSGDDIKTPWGLMYNVGLISKGVFSALTGGGDLVYDKDSHYIENLQFIGAAAISSRVIGKLASSYQGLHSQLPVSVVREIDALKKVSGPAIKYGLAAGRIANSFIGASTALPFVAIGGTYRALARISPKLLPSAVLLGLSYNALTEGFSEWEGRLDDTFNEQGKPIESWGLVDKKLIGTTVRIAAVGAAAIATVSMIRANPSQAAHQFRNQRLFRRAIPYYLAFTMARVMSDPDGDYTGNVYKDEGYRYQGVLGVGLLGGYLLDKTGVFRSQQDMAYQFMLMGDETHKRKVLELALKKPAKDAVGLIKETDEAIEKIMALKPDPNVKRLFSLGDHLTTKIGLPALLREIDPLNTTKLDRREFQVLGSRLKMAGAVLFGVGLAANIIANSFSDDNLRLLYQIPLLGSTLRLLAGVEPQNKLYGITGTQGVTGAERPAGLMGVLKFIGKKIPFGLGERLGLYSDKADPFLNIFGPIGQSFKGSGIGSYIQLASPFSDLSISSYVIGRQGSGPLLKAVSVLAQQKASLSAAASLKLAIARVRGQVARKTAMQFDQTLTAAALGSISSSITSRALAIRQAATENTKWQTGNELALDMLKEGIATGDLASTAIKTGRLARLWNPLQSLTGTFYYHKASVNQEAQLSFQTLEDWAEKADDQHTIGDQLAGIFSLQTIQRASDAIGNPLLKWPLMVAAIGAAGAAVYGGLSALATLAGEEGVRNVINNSKLLTGRNFIPMNRYTFTPFRSSSSGLVNIIQLDLQKRSSKGYVLELDVHSLISSADRTLKDTQVVGALRSRFDKNIGNLNKYFSTTLVAGLQDLSLGQTTKQALMTNVSKDMKQLLGRYYTSELIPGSKVSIYETFYGRTPNIKQEVAALVDELAGLKGSLLSQAVDEAAEVIKLNKASPKLGMVKGVQALEGSSYLAQFVQRVQEPVAGLYSPKEELATFRGLTGQTAKQYIRESLDLRAQVGKSRVGEVNQAIHNNVRNLVRSQTKPWSEGAIRGTIKAGQGAASLFSHLTSTVNPLYEVIEGAGLALDKDQPGYLQQAGKELAVRSVQSSAMMFAVQAGLMAAGLTALPALLVGVAASVGFSLLTEKVEPLKIAEQNWVRGVGNLVFNPIQTIGRAADKVHLGGLVRGIGGLITAPIGLLTGLLGKGINLITSNITGPLLAKLQPTQKDSQWMQFLKTTALPHTAYSAQLYLKQDANKQALAEIRAAIIGSSPLPIHAYLQGRTGNDGTNYLSPIIGEQATQSKYFTSYAGGGRVLSSFGLPAYRISNLLNMALERRQYQHDHGVIGARINRINNQEPPSLTHVLLMGMAGAVAANFNLIKAKGAVLFKPVTNQFGRLLTTSVGRSAKNIVLGTQQRAQLLRQSFGWSSTSLELKTLPSRFNNVLNAAQLLLTGKNSTPTSKLALGKFTELRNHIATTYNIDPARLPETFDVINSKFEVGGEFRTKANSIGLTSIAEAGLARNNKLSRLAQFAALHELSHSADLIGGAKRLTLRDLKAGLAETSLSVRKVNQLVDLMSQASTVKYAATTNATRSLLSRVYTDELSANVRSVLAMQARGEDITGLINDLRSKYKGQGNTLREFRNLIKGAATVGQVEDGGIRFLRKAPKLNMGPELGGVIRRIGESLGAPFSKGTTKLTLPHVTADSFIKRWKGHLKLGELFGNQLLPNSRFVEDVSNVVKKGISIKSLAALGILTSFMGGFLAYQTTKSSTGLLFNILEGLSKESALAYRRTVHRPIRQVIHQANFKLAKVGLNVFDALDSVFTGIDIWMSVASANQAKQTSADLNKALLDTDKATLLEDKARWLPRIEEDKNLQLGSYMGNILGTGAAFAARNPLFGLLGGLGATVGGLIGFGGLNKQLAESDFQRASEGHAIYDPFQSSGTYLRSHKDFFSVQAATQNMFAPLRSLIKKGLRFGWNVAKKVVPPLYRLLKLSPALGVSIITSIILPGGSTVLGVGGFFLKGVSQVGHKTLTHPVIGTMGANLATLTQTAHSLLKTEFEPWWAKKLARHNKLSAKVQVRENKGLIKLGRVGAEFIGDVALAPFRLGKFVYQAPPVQFGLDVLRTILDSGISLRDPAFAPWWQKKLTRYNKLTARAQAKENKWLTKYGGRLAQLSVEFIGDTILTGYKATKTITKAGLFAGRQIGKVLSFGWDVAQTIGDSGISLRDPGFAPWWAKKLAKHNQRSLVAQTKETAFIKRMLTGGRELLQEGYQFFKDSADALYRTGAGHAAWWKSQQAVATEIVEESSSLGVKPSKPLALAGKLNKWAWETGHDLARFIKDLPKNIIKLPRLSLNKASELLSHVPGLAKQGWAATTEAFRKAQYFSRAAIVLSKRKIINPIRSVVRGVEIAAIKGLNKYSAPLGRYLAIKGFKESLFDVMAPVMDLATFTQGSGDILSLNKGSSLAEVEAAYIKTGASRRSLVGSVAGTALGGSFAELIGSSVGQLTVDKPALERAKERYEAQDYGLAPLLQDEVKPLIRDVALAGHLGNIGKELIVNPLGKALTLKMNVKLANQAVLGVSPRARLDLLTRSATKQQLIKATKLNLLERGFQAITTGVAEGKEEFLSSATRRLEAAGGKATVQGINKVLKSTGYLARGAGKVATVAMPFINAYLIGSGYAKLQSATTEAQYVSGSKRLSGSVGSVVGGIVGGIFGGGVGALVGSVAGEAIGNLAGANIAKRAYANKVSGKKVSNWQVAGLVGGVLLGAAAGAALLAAGLIAAPVVLAAAAIAGFVGLIGGGYAAIYGGKVKAKLSKTNKPTLAPKELPLKAAQVYPVPIGPRQVSPLEAKYARLNTALQAAAEIDRNFIGPKQVTPLEAKYARLRTLLWAADEIAERDRQFVGPRQVSVAEAQQARLKTVLEGAKANFIGPWPVSKQEAQQARMNTVIGEAKFNYIGPWPVTEEEANRARVRMAEQEAAYERWKDMLGTAHQSLNLHTADIIKKNGKPVEDPWWRQTTTSMGDFFAKMAANVTTFVSKYSKKVLDYIGGLAKQAKALAAKALTAVGNFLSPAASATMPPSAYSNDGGVSGNDMSGNLPAGITRSTLGKGTAVGASREFTPAVRAYLDLIARKEIDKYQDIQGYRSKNADGYFSDDVSKGFPASQIAMIYYPGIGMKPPDVGRYQFRKSDYDEFRAKDPRIQGFTPIDQDLLALGKLKYRGVLEALNRGDLPTAIRRGGAEWASMPQASAGGGRQRAEGWTMEMAIAYYQQQKAFYESHPNDQTTMSGVPVNVSDVQTPTQGQALGTGKIIKTQSYRITDSNYSHNINTYADISRHHAKRGHENRTYGVVGGREEEIREKDGSIFVKKDLILDNYNIPSAVSGYAFPLHDAYNTVQLYADPARTKFLGQILHMDSLAIKDGQYVQYGTILGRQGGRGPEGQHAYGDHAHWELQIDTFKRYIASLKSGVFQDNAGSVPQGREVTASNPVNVTACPYCKATNHNGQQHIAGATANAPQASSPVQPLSSTNNNQPAMPATGKPNSVLLRRTGKKDDKGLEIIATAVYGDDGKAKGLWYTNSGDPKNQRFGAMGTTPSGTRAPIEFGDYTLGQAVAGGSAAVGAVFIPINPSATTQRKDIGFHVDADRSTKVGSAGCVVFKTEAEFKTFRAALAQAKANTLRFDSTIAQPSQAATLAPSGTTPQSMPSGSQASGPRIKPYQIESWSGQSNNSGIRGNYDVHSFEEVTPHWNGTGGYTNYREDPRFKKHKMSYVGGSDNLVMDLHLSQDGNVDVPTLAPADGIVITAGGSYGVVAIKMRDGRVVRLLHNRNISVRVGQEVTFGQPVGRQGTEGTGGGSSNYHAHLEAPYDVAQRYVSMLLTGNLGGGTANPNTTANPSIANATTANPAQGSVPIQTGIGQIQQLMVPQGITIGSPEAIPANYDFSLSGTDPRYGSRTNTRGVRPARMMTQQVAGAYYTPQGSALPQVATSSPQVVSNTANTASVIDNPTAPAAAAFMGPGGVLSEEQQFVMKTIQVAQSIGVNPRDLLLVMGQESGWNPKEQIGNGATGLIQFMPETARGLGTTVGAIKGMSRVEQLPLVRKYLVNYVTNGSPEVYRKGGLRALYGAILEGNAKPRGNSSDSYGTTVDNAIPKMQRQRGPEADRMLASVGWNGSSATLQASQQTANVQAQQPSSNLNNLLTLGSTALLAASKDPSKYDEAIINFQKAIKANPNSKEAKDGLAKALLSKQQSKKSATPLPPNNLHSPRQRANDIIAAIINSAAELPGAEEAKATMLLALNNAQQAVNTAANNRRAQAGAIKVNTKDLSREGVVDTTTRAALPKDNTALIKQEGSSVRIDLTQPGAFVASNWSLITGFGLPGQHPCMDTAQAAVLT